MRYQDFTITISAAQEGGCLVTALSDELGRVAATQNAPDAELQARLAAVTAAAELTDAEGELRAAGEALFRWLTAGPIENHLRLAWDRPTAASRACGCG